MRPMLPKVRRFTLPLLSIVALVGCHPKLEGERLPDGAPVLRMPFPAGTVAVCYQGNRSAAGKSHSQGDNTFALDLGNPLDDAQPVAAAAPGVVSYVGLEVQPAGEHSSPRLGTLVKVDHGAGYYTVYAHLKSVSVHLGDHVPSGTVLGVMGDTGEKGEPHLHFSLNHGDPRAVGVSPAVPIQALVVADLDHGGAIERVQSTALVGDFPPLPDRGRYGSENEGGMPPRLGVPDAKLSKLFADRYGRLKALLSARR